MRLILFHSPGKKFVSHKISEVDSWLRPRDTRPALGQPCFTDRFRLLCCNLVRQPRGLTNSLSPEPKLIPINIPSFVDAHICLLSFGTETETLQPSRSPWWNHVFLGNEICTGDGGDFYD